MIALIGGLIALRVWLAVLLWEPGWSALTWDDFSRVAHARAWAADPTVVPDLVWLPLPIWLYGLVFRLTGSWFTDNPLLLAAVVNTTIMMAVAAVSAWTARRLFHSTGAGVAAGLAMLFAPWGVWLSLSGLSEPVYFLTVAAAMAATLRWLQERRPLWLGMAALAIAAGAASRYEGWVMLVSWAAVLAWRELRPPRPAPTPGIHPLWIIAAPGLVPIAWALVNLQRTGNPLFFAEESARIFLDAYGALYGLVTRAFYYPTSLLRAAPAIILIAVLVVVAKRRDRTVVTIALVPGLAFALLWASSLISPAVGAFNERYLFAFAVAVVPIAGGLLALPTVPAPRRAVAGVTAGVVGAVALAAFRLPHVPEEWTAAPDLLALTEALGEVADPDDPLTVIVGEGMQSDVVMLEIRNGDALHVVVPGSPTDPASLGPGEILLERLPQRLDAIGAPATTQVGRYAVYGETSAALAACPGCTGWTYRSETGSEQAIDAGGYVPLEFVGDDPAPGSEAVVWIDLASPGATAVLELRSLYGHGFNPGRLELQVRSDGVVVFRRDIAEPSRWLTVHVSLPTGSDPVRLEVVVVAQPGIEIGWGWGRASTVLIRSLTVEE